MKLKTSLLAMAALGLSLCAIQAQAHKPWLLPSSTLVEGKEPWVTVDAAISEGLFDIDHQPLKLDGVLVTAPDGANAPLENIGNGKLRNTFDVRLNKPGTYRIALVSHSVMGSYKDAAGETKRFRGSEVTLAKDVPADASDVKLTRTVSRLETFVSAGTPDRAVFKPSGVGLELVPVSHPNDLRSGEQATWRFLLDGKPVANLGVSLIPGGVRYRGTLGELRKQTDANGEVRFELPAAGMYMLSSSWPVAAPAVAGQPPVMPARRASYAATLEILPQ